MFAFLCRGLGITRLCLYCASVQPTLKKSRSIPSQDPLLLCATLLTLQLFSARLIRDGCRLGGCDAEDTAGGEGGAERG